MLSVIFLSLNKARLINPLYYNLNMPVSVVQPNMKQLIAYPNPTHDEIFFDIAIQKPMEYMIVNAIGKTIYKGLLDKNSISISTLNVGYYAIIIQEEGEHIGYFKFVKQ